MKSTAVFEITNGVLMKYIGPGGYVAIPEGIRGIGDGAFWECTGLTGVRIPESVTDIGRDAFYLGGPLSDLPEEDWHGAARGFLFARERGIRETGRWKEEYLDYFRDHADAFAEDAKEDRSVLLFLTGEGLLDREGTDRLLRHFLAAGDVEAKAVLLQYRQRFGEDGLGDIFL